MRHVGRALALLLAASSAPLGLAQAPTPSFKPLGPPGEAVHAIVVDPKSPKTVWAGTRLGVYKSVDGAATWTKSSKGLEDRTVLGLAIDPANPKVLYAAAWRGGLWKSLDAGASWKSVTPGSAMFDFAGRVPMRAVALDATNPKRLIFGSLFKSADSGTTWSAVDPPAYPSGHRDVNALAFDPKDGKVVWSGDTGSLKRSADFGASWKVVDIGVPEPVHVKVVAVNPKDPSAVLVGTGYAGLFRTTDWGATWQRSESGLTDKAAIRAIAFDPVDPKRVYVAAGIKSTGEATSVFLSEDGGKTFVDLGADLPWEPIHALAVDPTDPRTVYAGTGFSGVYATRDGGKSWDEASRGLPLEARTVNALVVRGGELRRADAPVPGGSGGRSAPAERTGDTLLATTFGNVHRSDDGGATWRRLRSGIRKGAPIDRLEAAANGETLLVAAGSRDDELRFSADGGDSWNQPTRGRGIRCLFSDPRQPGMLLACTSDGGVYRLGGGGSFARFGDEGFTTTLDSLAVDPAGGQTLLASESGRGLWRSTNGGKKWKPFNEGVAKVKGSDRFGEYRVFFSMSWPEPRTLYGASEGDGVWKSADGGATWSKTALAEPKLTAFAVDPANAARLAAGTETKGVFLSTDGGATWTNRAQGLPDDGTRGKSEVRGVGFGSGSRLYVAVEDGGVYAWSE